MSLLPGQIIPPTEPLGRVNADGSVTIGKNWWLLIFNLCQQVLSNGQGPTTLEIAELGYLKAKGPDYERMIADLRSIVASLPNPAGRIAALEARVHNLENMSFLELKAG